jgi:hypothetical protein
VVLQVKTSNPSTTRLLSRSRIRTDFLNELATFQGQDVCRIEGFGISGVEPSFSAVRESLLF